MVKKDGANDFTKEKRYYKVKEKVWLVPHKTTAVVLGIDLANKVAEVSYFNNNNELVKDKFMLWEIDKLRKPNKKIEIPIKYFTELDERVEGKEGFYELEEIAVGNWIDLRVPEDVEIKHFEQKLIPLGIAMQLPEGYEAWVVPRSSTYKKWGIIQGNHFGVIDNTYCGDNDQWFMSAIALRGDTIIKRGDRVCQFRIMKTMQEMDGHIEFKRVDRLGNKDRHGFGSTG